MKRIIDIILSLLILILFSPIGFIIILILKFTGENEIFYKQERVGKNGKIFEIYKFTTMVKNSPNFGAGDITIKNDPRVLPFGKILRKLKLNEFPQSLIILSDTRKLKNTISEGLSQIKSKSKDIPTNITTTTSSNEVMKAKRAPEITPGKISGISILKKLRRGPPPRLAAALVKL